jgi:hypothetical protein
MCEDGCGFFAPLHLMSPTDLSMGEQNKQQGRENSGQPSKKNTYSDVVSSRNGKQHQPVPIDSGVHSTLLSEFRLGERVHFYSKRGAKHFGIVRWTGREIRTKKFEYLVVGIQTVSYVNYLNLKLRFRVSQACCKQAVYRGLQTVVITLF